jgi:hypothetical protein
MKFLKEHPKNLTRRIQWQMYYTLLFCSIGKQDKQKITIKVFYWHIHLLHSGVILLLWLDRILYVLHFLNILTNQTKFTLRGRNWTCPFSRRPRYTRPKPPSPIRQSCLKFFVAFASSRNVNVCAAICVLPSFGTCKSFLESVPVCCFNFSAQMELSRLNNLCNDQWRNKNLSTIFPQHQLGTDTKDLLECVS